MDDKFSINTEKQIEEIIGAPLDKVRSKIIPQLDDVMKEFIRRSPLIFVSTADENGHIEVSPKGDPDGFVQIDESGNLLIPERPGNKLAFGFRNILQNREVGIIFLVTNQKETLRVKGTATLHNDPDILNQMKVKEKPALLYTRVEIRECFFHCGKALIRSNLWKPEFWDNATDSLGLKHFSNLEGGGKEVKPETKKQMDKAYKDELY